MTAAEENFGKACSTGESPPAGRPFASGRGESLPLIARSLARGLAASLSRGVKIPLAVQPLEWSAVSYEGFLAGLQEAGCCWLLQAGDEALWLELSSTIARAVASALLDGGGEPARQCDRPPTPVERRVLGRFVGAAVEAIEQSRAGGAGAIGAAPIRVADQAAAPAASDHAREVVQASFMISMLSCQGRMTLCLPAGFLMEKLTDTPPEQGAAAPPDVGQWVSAAAESGARQPAQPEHVDLTVLAPETTIPLDELRGMTPGDVLVTDANVGDEVLVYVDGKRRFAARLGSRNGKRAITILRELPEQEQAE